MSAYGGLKSCRSRFQGYLETPISSFVVWSCFLVGDYSIPPKQELHRSLQIELRV